MTLRGEAAAAECKGCRWQRLDGTELMRQGREVGLHGRKAPMGAATAAAPCRGDDPLQRCPLCLLR